MDWDIKMQINGSTVGLLAATTSISAATASWLDLVTGFLQPVALVIAIVSGLFAIKHYVSKDDE